jgi:hypothetical protein
MCKEFYTEFEKVLMKKYHCRILKMTVCIDGIGEFGALNALDEIIHRVVKDDPYIEKRGVFKNGFTAYVICFEKEEGLSGWLVEFPEDIRFIEKDFGEDEVETNRR